MGGHPASCRDISMGGIGLSAGLLLETGSPVNVEIMLPDGPVLATGEIVRNQDGEVALRFTKLDQSSIAALLSYVGAGVPASALDS